MIIKGGLPTQPLLFLHPGQEPVVWAPDGSVHTLRPMTQVQDEIEHYLRYYVIGPDFFGASERAKPIRVPAVGRRKAHP